MGSNQDFSAGAGFARVVRAYRYSYAGLRHALRHESALRQELAVLLLMLPVAVLLPVSRLERLLLLLSMLLVVLVEFLNSALEAVVDRISLERHPLSGSAKDMGSAAVSTAVGMSLLCWLVIAGPVLWDWLRSTVH